MLEQIERHRVVRMELEEAKLALDQLQDILRQKDQEILQLAADRDRIAALISAPDVRTPNRSFAAEPRSGAGTPAGTPRPRTPRDRDRSRIGTVAEEVAAAEIDRLEGMVGQLRQEVQRAEQERAAAREQHCRDVTDLRRQLDEAEDRRREAEARVIALEASSGRHRGPGSASAMVRACLATNSSTQDSCPCTCAFAFTPPPLPSTDDSADALHSGLPLPLCAHSRLDGRLPEDRVQLQAGGAIWRASRRRCGRFGRSTSGRRRA